MISLSHRLFAKANPFLASLRNLSLNRLAGLLVGLAMQFMPGWAHAEPTTTLYNFGQQYDGTNSVAALTQAADGSFWGTTTTGGPQSGGTVFRMASDGTVTNLVSFPDAAYPYGKLLRAADGNFYGVTNRGGANDRGTVFRLTPAGDYSVIYSFTGSRSAPVTGCFPGGQTTVGTYTSMDLVQGADSFLYGTTSGCGASGFGTVFKIKPDGTGFSTLRSFANTNDGAYPVVGVVFGTDGLLYGTTYTGGNTSGTNYGTIFRLNTSGGSFTVLKRFTGTAPDGQYPQAALLPASDGALYGTTYLGGANGYGLLFKITTGGAFTRLYSFTYAADGAYPIGALVQASDGKLYGHALGSSNNAIACHTAFSATTAGVVSTLYNFTCDSNGGGLPLAPFTVGTDGNLYGSTYGYNSGASGNSGGTLYRLSTSGALSTLHRFDLATADGLNPRAPLLAAADGNFYSTAIYGGAKNGGTIYRLTPAGAHSTLYSFDNSYNGCNAGDSGLYQDSSGQFWGTTQGCGASSRGIFYSFGTGGSFNLLYAFLGSSDGSTPFGTLVPDGNGNFYGVTNQGGKNGAGAIYKMTPWGVPTTLYSFPQQNTSNTEGANPNEGLVRGDDGNLYGTTQYGGTNFQGTVFRITPTGVLTTLHSFGNDGSDGYYPAAELVKGADGFLYGTTTYGGTKGGGVVFRISQSGSSYSVRKSFDCATTIGCYPQSGLVIDRDGSLYGTTTYDSVNASNGGSAYRLTPSGSFTALRGFGNGRDGSQPNSTLTLNPADGQLYGVTQGGGLFGSGIAFRISLPPVAPIALTAAPGNASVTLNWTGSVGATSYKVFQGTTPGGEGASPVQSGLSTTSATVTGLTNGTTYYFTVKAVNATGDSIASTEASATPIAAPAAPTGLSAARGNARVSLSWTAAPTASSYKIYQGTSSGGESPTPVLSGVTGTGVVVPGLSNGTQYFFRIAATNAGGDSPYSNEASATPFGQPAAPQNLTATGGPGQVSLNWQASLQADNYNVYQSTTAGGEGTTPVRTAISGTSVTISGLTNGTTYYFKVTAGNSVGESPQSSEASAVPSGLTAPASLTAKAGAGKVTLSWAAVAGAASYNVYRGTTAGGEAPTPIKTGITTTTFSNSGLVNGTTYYYTVRAVSGSNTSLDSNEASATPLAIPVAPASLVATPANGAITLSWAASAGAASYNVYQATTPGGEGTTPVKKSITGTGVSITGLTNGTTYFFTVAAVNVSGTSPQSAEASATPNTNKAPSAPQAVSATPASGKVTLKWTASPTATSYSVYRGTSPGGEGPTPIQTGITATSFAVTGLSNGTTYYFQVTASSANGEGARSLEVAATPTAKPGVPGSLTATAGNAAVNLAWTAAANAASYNVYQGTSAGGEAATPVATRITATSTTISGLTAGRTYYFKVAAVNPAGTGTQSNEASATPSGTAPSAAITDLSAQPGNTVVSLNWSAIPGASSYNVYQGTAAGAEGATPVRTGLTANGVSIGGLSNGATYFFKVAAVNAGGTSAASNEASATPVAAPAAPTSLAAARGDQKVTLSWTASAGASSYNVYQGTSAGGEGSTPVLSGVTGTTVAVTGLVNGTSYYFTVTAVGPGGRSPASNEASARPVAAPLAPTNLSATAGNGSVTLSWTAAANASSYRLYQGTTPGGEAATPVQVGITGTTASVSGLSNGTNYYFTVTAANPSGESGYSNETVGQPNLFAYNVVYHFGTQTDGSNPQSPLVRTSDGSLYGTAYSGGPATSNGTVFRIAPDGTRSTLHYFEPQSYPNGLILGADGRLYGTTQRGGGSAYGTVFRLDTSGNNFAVLYTFGGGQDGAYPSSALVQDTDGSLYGVTQQGGLYGKGAIFRINTDGTGRVTMKSFAGGSDGEAPQTPLVPDGSGGFYGTTYGGGSGFGLVYRFSPVGWTYSVLYAFASKDGVSTDGYSPKALLRGSDGKLYGALSVSGTSTYGNGLIYSLSTSGVFSPLYVFSGGSDGAQPFGLIQANDGLLYGVTFGGGVDGEGTVFKLSTGGAYSAIYQFKRSTDITDDGANPSAGVIQGSDGLLYGTTVYGAAGSGDVFKLTTAGSFTRLYAFTNQTNDGNYPASPLLKASDGNYYGTTQQGGANGYGAVYRLTPAGVYTTIYSFSTSGTDGVYPAGPLAQGSDGLLYGATQYGGTSGNGTIYKLKTDGTGFVTLRSLNGTIDGRYPNSGLIRASNGSFYGVTQDGQSADGSTGYCGVVFRITAAGAFTALKGFACNSADGSAPNALMQASDGNLYGTTQYGGASNAGTVFKLSLSGAFTSLYSFDYYSAVTGFSPGQGLVQGTDGLLYGTTAVAGPNGGGVFFKITTAGAITPLYGFTVGTDGNPSGYQARLIQASDGNFYGTSYGGGSSNAGTLFRVSPAGTFTLLKTFTGAPDGANPIASLLQASDGSIYGTATTGGNIGNGEIFRIQPNP